MATAAVWVSSVDADATDSRGRTGFRISGRIRGPRDARFTLGIYLLRTDGVPIACMDPTYSDDNRAAAVAESIRMTSTETSFSLFIPRGSLVLSQPMQPLWAAPALFDSQGRHFYTGPVYTFWTQPLEMPAK